MHDPSGTDRAYFLCLVCPLNLGGVEFPLTASRIWQAYNEMEGDILGDGAAPNERSHQRQDAMTGCFMSLARDLLCVLYPYASTALVVFLRLSSIAAHVNFLGGMAELASPLEPAFETMLQASFIHESSDLCSDGLHGRRAQGDMQRSFRY